ncbi:hypothetical protein [Helicobacter suis]|uniref:hypothetical protein n=1 Tax=Helicobacter suis TaxID=104628 RepID=UPI0013D02F1B|nr:hypothetical protein [Helicobacter suis]
MLKKCIVGAVFSVLIAQYAYAGIATPFIKAMAKAIISKAVKISAHIIASKTIHKSSHKDNKVEQ